MENKKLHKRLKQCIKLLKEIAQDNPADTPEDITKKERELKKRIDKPLSMAFIDGIDYLSDKRIVDLGEKFILNKELDYPRHKIHLRITSRIEYQNRLHPCQKEPWTIEWIEKFLKPKDIMYDVGANVGAYSLVASKFTEGQVKIFAFEPGFSTFSELCYNIILNNCQDSIVPLSVALSDKTEVAQFNYSDLTPGKAFHQSGEWKANEKHSTPVYKQLMLCYRIDDLIKGFGLPVPNHIKIDVDGTEMKVLQGASETISNMSVKSLMVESNEFDSERIVKFIKQRGFDLFSRFNGEEDSKRPFYLLFKRSIRNESIV